MLKIDEAILKMLSEEGEDKFRYDGKIKIKQITKDEWENTPKDYKLIRDGQKYIMYLDKDTQATVLGRCEIIDESLNEDIDMDEPFQCCVYTRDEEDNIHNFCTCSTLGEAVKIYFELLQDLEEDEIVCISEGDDADNRCIRCSIDESLNEAKLLNRGKNIKKESLNENLKDSDISKIVDAIQAELAVQGYVNLFVSVDEETFEPSVTFFTNFYNDNYSIEQAELIQNNFNLFKTTISLDNAIICTREDVRIFSEGDGNERAEGSVDFSVVISPDVIITDEYINKIAAEYVQQINNFWDAVFSDEFVNESLNETKNSYRSFIKDYIEKHPECADKKVEYIYSDIAKAWGEYKDPDDYPLFIYRDNALKYIKTFLREIKNESFVGTYRIDYNWVEFDKAYIKVKKIDDMYEAEGEFAGGALNVKANSIDELKSLIRDEIVEYGYNIENIEYQDKMEI